MSDTPATNQVHSKVITIKKPVKYIPIDQEQASEWLQVNNNTFQWFIDNLSTAHRRQELFILRKWLKTMNLTDTNLITDAFCPIKDTTSYLCTPSKQPFLSDGPFFSYFFTGLKDIVIAYKLTTLRKLFWVWRQMIKAVNWDTMVLVNEQDALVNNANLKIIAVMTVELACFVTNQFFKTGEYDLPVTDMPPAYWEEHGLIGKFAVPSNKLNAKFKHGVKFFSKRLQQNDEEHDTVTDSDSDSKEQASYASLDEQPKMLPEYEPILKVISQWIQEKPGLAVKILEIVASAV